MPRESRVSLALLLARVTRHRALEPGEALARVHSRHGVVVREPHDSADGERAVLANRAQVLSPAQPSHSVFHPNVVHMSAWFEHDGQQPVECHHLKSTPSSSSSS